jgi:hypothetical protein
MFLKSVQILIASNMYLYFLKLLNIILFWVITIDTKDYYFLSQPIHRYGTRRFVSSNKNAESFASDSAGTK